MKVACLTMPVIISVLAGCVTADLRDRNVPLFDNLGSHHHKISTKVSLTQRYFDQGLIFSYGFNHAEAERSFREAVRLDPSCAICYWGVALVLGPNINAGMDDEAVFPAYDAVQKAMELSDRTDEREKAYIIALSKRYEERIVKDRASLDIAYAEAMRDLVKRYPDDLDAATLFAEALMDLHPWNYWTKEGVTRPWTPEILKALESVMKRNSEHPGANHLYIHAMEASPHPERALPSADRLRNLVPGIGHLVHMPGHIYIRVGRYHEASEANERAIESDHQYMQHPHTEGVYQLAYMPHDHHFLWASSTLEGRSQRAIQAARDMASGIDPERMRSKGLQTLQHFWITPLYAWVRFGKWDEILDQPMPDEDLVYPTAIWHYARGIAFIRKSRLEEAIEEFNRLSLLAEDPRLESITIGGLNTTANLAQIAKGVLAGELAASEEEYPNAIGYLRTAVVLEDSLNYDEPPPWHHPVRQSLGAVLLMAEQPVEAERTYREDLRRHPKNGWALFGLAQSLEAQGKEQEAEEVWDQFETAWNRADVKLTSSRF